jgi:hypothetical protein
MLKQRRPAHRARAAVCWGVGSFLVLQLGLALSIERWLPELRDPTYAIKARLLSQRVAANPGRPLTVVMVGSSRVEYGLLAGALEDQLAPQLGSRPVVFNFGISGAGLVTELLVVRRLLADGVRPDLVLIEILPSCFAGQIPSSELPRLTADRLWLADLPIVARYGASLPDLRANWWEAWPVPWYSHRYAILARTAPFFLPDRGLSAAFGKIDASGVGTLLDTPPDPDAYQRNVESTRACFAPCFEQFRLSEDACQSLRELLTLCRQERMATALVLMPEGQPFRALYSAEAWSEIAACLTSLSREFDAPLLNARDWIADDQFSDSHHLLRTGAQQFTERLGREHLGPMLTVTRLVRSEPL